jgi:hypothetical protein
VSDTDTSSMWSVGARLNETYKKLKQSYYGLKMKRVKNTDWPDLWWWW